MTLRPKCPINLTFRMTYVIFMQFSWLPSLLPTRRNNNRLIIFKNHTVLWKTLVILANIVYEEDNGAWTCNADQSHLRHVVVVFFYDLYSIPPS